MTFFDAATRWARVLGLALVLGSLSTSVLAWSYAGHRISGLVAERLLTPEAKAGLGSLMGDTGLATIALYMDKRKLELKHRYPNSHDWHFDNRPVCDAAVKREVYCPNGNCASVQIDQHYQKLVAAHSTIDERRFAILVLVHLVGDIHQPLHASDHDDRGGNKVEVKLLLPKGRVRSTNLHSAWDTNFVDASFDTLDERRIARKLVESVSEQTLESWQQGSVDDWMAESYAIAQHTAYGALPGFRCAGGGGTRAAAERLLLDGTYVGKATAIVPTQLAKAGARIAYVLNRAFAK